MRSYDIIFAAKWSSNGGLEAVVFKVTGSRSERSDCLPLHFFIFGFSPPNALSLIIPLTKLGMKDLLKNQQWRVERDSNLIPPHYRPNALTTTPSSTLNCQIL